MNVLALCTGIGGIELGIKLANPAARCVCYVEGEAYAAAILVKRMEEKALDEAPIWSDVRTFDGKPWCGKVDCITAGYPCQPFSSAGKRTSESDPRHLLPSIRRIISETQPTRCFFENVAAHLSLGFETVANDLQTMGYKVAAGVFSAEEVGATHTRKRLFIMANAQSDSRCNSSQFISDESCFGWTGDRKGTGWQQSGTVCCANDDTSSQVPVFPPGPSDLGGWRKLLGQEPTLAATIAPFCGMAHGFPDRLDRLRTVGNAVMPLVAAYAWRVLEGCLTDDGLTFD